MGAEGAGPWGLTLFSAAVGGVLSVDADGPSGCGGHLARGLQAMGPAGQEGSGAKEGGRLGLCCLCALGQV